MVRLVKEKENCRAGERLRLELTFGEMGAEVIPSSPKTGGDGTGRAWENWKLNQ